MRVELSSADFERVRALLAKTAGLVFDECRRDSLAYSLGERCSAPPVRARSCRRCSTR